MYLSGFADEAADDLAGQIGATRALGWKNIEARSIDGVNINDLPEDAFARAVDRLGEAGVRVNCLGSVIANWGKRIDEDFSATLAEVDRAIARMHCLGTGLIRIMSYRVMLDGTGKALPDQMRDERFRRLREICRRFTAAGVTPVHENCKNYGGMGWRNTLELVENVPGLSLVFDTGNPPANADYARGYPYPRQSSWDFYTRVKRHIAYVHIKDVVWNGEKKSGAYCYPGEGEGDVARIVADLLAGGYDGGFSIEPHMVVVFHEQDAAANAESRRRFDNYTTYGRKFMELLSSLGRPLTE